MKKAITYVEDLYLTNIPTYQRKPRAGEPYIAYVTCQKAGQKAIMSFEGRTRKELHEKIAAFLDHTPHEIVKVLP